MSPFIVESHARQPTRVPPKEEKKLTAHRQVRRQVRRHRRLVQVRRQQGAAGQGKLPSQPPYPVPPSPKANPSWTFDNIPQGHDTDTLVSTTASPGHRRDPLRARLQGRPAPGQGRRHEGPVDAGDRPAPVGLEVKKCKRIAGELRRSRWKGRAERGRQWKTNGRSLETGEEGRLEIRKVEEKGIIHLCSLGILSMNLSVLATLLRHTSLLYPSSRSRSPKMALSCSSGYVLHMEGGLSLLVNLPRNPIRSYRTNRI